MRSDAALLLDMLIAGEKIERFIGELDQDQFEKSELHQSAVIRELQVLGEAARQVSEVTRTAHPEIEWVTIIGMRNRVVHEYFRIDFDLMWRTLQEDIPVLVERLKPLIPPETE